MASSSSSSSGVPPGFRFHPTDEELLLYYLKKKISFEKFDLEVIREVDLNKMEPWDLQERCRIGSTPQNDWYFFSHKDKKYPTGSRTNRATGAGFWKATGRDKCIRNSYRKIGMRKTLVFYRGRAPHGQKTDWIMHEYRLEEADDVHGSGTEDGWVVCRVFKKKCFFKVGGNSEGTTSQATEIHMNASSSHHIHDTSRALSLGDTRYIHQQQNLHNHHHHHHQISNLYKPELAMHMPTHSYYSQVQVQNLLPNHRPTTLELDMVKPYQACEPGLDVSSSEPVQHMGEGRGQDPNDWAMLESTIEGRYGSVGGTVHQINQPSHQPGGEMDLWGYGK